MAWRGYLVNGRRSAGEQGQPIEISGEPFRSIAVIHSAILTPPHQNHAHVAIHAGHRLARESGTRQTHPGNALEIPVSMSLLK
jgi:hypothetical protein